MRTGRDPKIPRDFVLEHSNSDTSNTWNGLDCDGDGKYTNEDTRKQMVRDPLDLPVINDPAQCYPVGGKAEPIWLPIVMVTE